MKQKLYKILVDGKSCHGGDLVWSLPKGKKKGDWHTVDGKTKKENIKEAQDHKQEGIKEAAIIRDATQAAIAGFGGQGYTYDDFTTTWDRYAKFFQTKWEQAFF